MAQYDGSIRIGTEIDINGFEKGKKELEAGARSVSKSIDASIKEAEKEFNNLDKSIWKTAQKITSLKLEANKMRNLQIPTKEYSDAQKEVDKYSDSLQKAKEKIDKLLETGVDKKSSRFVSAQYDVAQLENKLLDVEEVVKRLEQEGKAFTLGTDTEKFANISNQIEDLTQKMQGEQQRQSQLQSDMEAKKLEKIQAEAAEEERLSQIRENAVPVNDEIIAKVERIKQLEQEIADLKMVGKTEGYADYDNRIKELSELKQGVKEYRDSLSTVPEKFEKMRKSAKKAFNAISDGTKKSSGFLSTFSSRLKGMAMSLLIFNWISKAFRAMISGMKQGFTNFMGYSDSFANSVQGMKNAMSTLGNQFVAAFSPIVQLIIPWLTKLINAISTAMTYVAQFIAILGGKSTFTRAKQVQDSYNKSLGGTAAAAKKAYGALARFDDLDVLQKKEDDSDAGGMADAMGDMFEEVPVDTKLFDIVDKFKDILSQFFRPFKEAWENEGEFVINSWKYALDEIWQLMKDIGRDFLIMWNEEATIQMFSDILHIIGDIGLIIGNIANALDEAWNKNDVGLRILENIRDIFAIIIEHIRSAADYTVEWSRGLDFYPLLESINGLLESLEPFADNIGAGLEWFYTNVLLPIAEWTIEDAVPAFLDMLSAAIDVLNATIEALQPLGIWLWDNFLQPLGEWAGEVIISAMQTITDLLTKFGDWISEHQETVQNFAIILGSFAAAWGIVSTAIGVWNGIATLASVVTTALGAAITFLTSPIGIVTIAIGALIAAGVLLATHWEELSVIASEVWGFIQEKFQEFDEWLTGVFATDWTEQFGILGGIFQLFSDVISSIWNGIKEIFNGIITFLTGVFTGDWQKAWDGITKIFEGVRDTIKGIINGILGFVESLANGVINAINAVIRALNALSFDVPDWIPGIGGESFGFNLSEIPNVSIPKLATGAVIRGGNPFMAILGDQPAGKTNIEAPAGLIKDMVAQGIAEADIGSRENIPVNINIIYDGETTARVMIPDILSELSRQGYNVDLLGYT